MVFMFLFDLEKGCMYFVCLRKFTYRYIFLTLHIPGTQMTLVLIGKDLVLKGSTTKIEDKQVPGIYTYFFFQFQ